MLLRRTLPAPALVSYLDDLAADIRSRVEPGLRPEGDATLLFRLYALLAVSKGDQVTARDVHDAWVVWMLERGEEHRSIVSFDQLDESVRQKDAPFVTAIRAAAAARVPR